MCPEEIETGPCTQVIYSLSSFPCPSIFENHPGSEENADSQSLFLHLQQKYELSRSRINPRNLSLL